MTDKIVSFKTGRKPLSLSPVPIVFNVISILGAFAKASDNIEYPVTASSSEKDLIFCEKICSLSNGHKNLTTENLKLTLDYLEASVKFANDCKLACDDAIEKAGESVTRELTTEEMNVFESMDTMTANELSVMKQVIDLLTAKMRACNESSDIIHPENASNETMLMIVKHVSLKRMPDARGKFTSRKRPREKKSARYSMGASCDSQPTNDYIDEIEESPSLNRKAVKLFCGAESPPEPAYTFSTKISSTEPFLISSTAGTSKSSLSASSKNSSIEPFLISSPTGTSKSSTMI
jgi:hypothetical protein